MYDIVSIKKDTTISEWLTNRAASAAANAAGQKGSATDGKVSQTRPDVKHQSRTTQDSAGNSLTQEQQEYFANSKARDEDGRLQVMYRGGNGVTFTVDQKCLYRVILCVYSGATVSNLVFKPQLEKGSTATSFVKGDATGMVWFSTGTSSNAAMNVDKKNTVMLYPKGCSQYIGGAWVTKTASLSGTI